MRIAKTTLRIIALLALALVLIVALFWRSLLSPQQKLHYGLTFEATEELRRSAQAHSTDKAALNHYVDGLVREGNFARAFYLMDLYGAQYTGPGASGLTELRKHFAEAALQTHFRRPVELRKVAAGKAFKNEKLPAYQALLYLDGYHQAALGDWHRAKELLGAIDEKKLAPPLRPYYQYFLGRALRLAGSSDEKKGEQIDKLYSELTKSAAASSGIKARARYNKIAALLDEKTDASTTEALQLMDQLHADQPAERWAYQKAKMEFANRAWGDKDYASAWSFASDALVAAPEDRASEAAGQMLVLVVKQGQAGSIENGLLTAWAKSAVLFGYGGDMQLALHAVVPKLGTKDAADLLLAQATLYAASGRDALLKQQTSSPQFAQAPVETRAEIRFMLAKLLEAKQLWNAALAEYSAVASLNSSHKAEALLARYLILKEVQEPLNLSVAVRLLNQVIATENHGADAATYGAVSKAVEELIPLLINSGQSSQASHLAQQALDGSLLAGDTTSKSPDQSASDSLKALGAYWRDYLADSQKPEPVKYWSYYELSEPPGNDVVAAKPPTLSDPESAAEYLAGLGLEDESLEALSDSSNNTQPASPAVKYCNLRIQSDWIDQPRQQWAATELLESGEVTDPAVLNYVLDQAYPTPHQDIVDQAAKQFSVDPALIYAVMKKESNFKEKAVSAVGAVGLMQLMPATASMMAHAHGLPASDLKDPAQNIPLGTSFLANLQSELSAAAAPPGPGEDQHDALIRAVLHCYNGGPGNYAKWRKLYPNADGTLLADLVPNEENEGFAKRVWKYYVIYKWRLKTS